MKSATHLMVLVVFCVIGCRHENDSTGGTENQPPTASAVATSNEVLNRLPAPVAAAFTKNHPHISPVRLHVRLFPDGTTHYQIVYSDGNGNPRQVEYYANGKAVP